MKFNEENMPQHIAIIMDGNRRWARAKENQQHLDIKKEQKH